MKKILYVCYHDHALEDIRWEQKLCSAIWPKWLALWQHARPHIWPPKGGGGAADCVHVR